MANISLKSIKKVYSGGVTAVRDFNLEIADREFMVLVGPSGCGKSTLLRMIAGLEDITAGDLGIGGRPVNDLPPKDRDIAMVFQNYALYPHMTIYQNLAFGLKMRKTPKDEIDSRVRAVAATLEIEPLLRRKPKALSGGERQRVALGRAMVREPAAFLLDEPLSNLDAKLRAAMRAELIKLHQKLQTTFVYVTHDQTEAMTMGDRITVMKEGVIQQVDSPHNLYHHPANVFVAGFIGSPQMNFLNGVLTKRQDAFGIQVDADWFPLPANTSVPQEKDGMPVVLGIRPESVGLCSGKAAAPGAARISARVEVIEHMGNEIVLHLDYHRQTVVARVSADAAVATGGQQQLSIKGEALHLFDAETGERI